jgi:hypothetical protein
MGDAVDSFVIGVGTVAGNVRRAAVLTISG